MRTIRTGLAVLAVLGLALAACGGSDGGSSTPPTTSSPEVVFNVNLDGLAEVPGPGAINATGNANIVVNPRGTTVCYTVQVSGIGAVTTATINEGKAGTAGPVVVTLKGAVPDPTKCVEATKSIIKGLTSGDRSFYVNVNTSEYPNGAIRAQLKG